MRTLLVFLLLSQALAAQHRLYAAMVNSRDYVVGAKLPQSGLMVRTPSGWEHRGFNHPYLVALVPDPRDPGRLYLAAGNGCILATEDARKWKILTDHTVTELRDIAASSEAGVVYIAHTRGVAVTRDGGKMWADVTGSERRRRYTESIRVDRSNPARLVAGGEDGVWVSENSGRLWRPTGARGFGIMRIEQSPHEPGEWLAVTMQGGIFRSTDSGRSFENLGDAGVGKNLYDINYDPTTRGRVAVAAWDRGVLVTEDGGKTWAQRNSGLPRWDIWSVAFDPGKPGRLFASVHEEALFVSEDSGRSWSKDGLDGAVCYRLVFVPEVKR